jgi:HEPN domain-containing protein
MLILFEIMKKENENYIRISLTDLESSKILYDNKKYPQAIFFLQQSVEKTTKGITGVHEERHRTWKPYEKIAKESNGEIRKLKEIKVIDEKILIAFLKVIRGLLFKIESGKSRLKAGKMTIPNMLLQHILTDHVNISRYPKGAYTPLEKYTKDHFLIKHYIEIHNIQKECLKECFKFFPK